MSGHDIINLNCYRWIVQPLEYLSRMDTEPELGHRSAWEMRGTKPSGVLMPSENLTGFRPRFFLIGLVHFTFVDMATPSKWCSSNEISRYFEFITSDISLATYNLYYMPWYLKHTCTGITWGILYHHYIMATFIDYYHTIKCGTLPNTLCKVITFPKDAKGVKCDNKHWFN